MAVHDWDALGQCHLSFGRHCLEFIGILVMDTRQPIFSMHDLRHRSLKNFGSWL